MRHYLLLLFIGFALCFTSCREDFEFEQSTGSLEFSRDTVYLDTVFTNIGSSTYTLKVYNRSNKDIKIPSIKLGEGEQSKYRLMVDGQPGKVFSDVELMAKDSMFIFIETTIDYTEYANNETTFLYNDKILFDSGTKEQKVELVTLVQDAVFIKPDRPLPDAMKEKLTINGQDTELFGHELSTPEELHWTNEKPYVIYGYALVPNNKTLTVDAGARVHFHGSSGLIVDKTGSININGTLSSTEELENEVIFEGDRLEPEFSDIPGQWNNIWLFSGEENNTIEHLTLKNAVIGIYMVSIDNDETLPKLTINNSQIYNCVNFGVLTVHSVLSGDNLVINNCGQASLALTQGGTYNFKQCTFANYFGSFNQVPVLINDYYETDDTLFVSDVTANFDNCILYGSSNIGMSLENKAGNQIAFKCKFNYCLIKLVDYSNQFKNNPLYPSTGNISDLVLYHKCKIARSSTEDRPDFLDPQNNKLNLGDAQGGANGAADVTIAALVPNDITGTPRNTTATPDIGAYESTTFTED
ncbi:hypothetical protein [Flavobacterium sp. NRK1]|uniref:hypothetical protein n=1 Tax=Flavobacterium sp. NRK1 TaxID=2954929 RepID=UPI00209260A4|nr:hypothetical protein [Flavobacterium sp. NRK1]MCO6146552.1 hypothetical protein [Flavobacterium sp. NRK1]